jgi:hypothetical protein
MKQKALREAIVGYASKDAYTPVTDIATQIPKVHYARIMKAVEQLCQEYKVIIAYNPYDGDTIRLV